MTHKIISFALLSIILNSCGQSYSAYETSEKFAYQFAEQFKKEKTDHPWFLFGFGGSYNDKIKIIGLDFIISDKAEIAKARTLIIEVIEKFITEINNSLNVQPYLSNHPFTYHNIEFSLSFIDKNTQDLNNAQFLETVEMSKGKLHYYIKIPTSNALIQIIEEAYEEALQIDNHK